LIGGRALGAVLELGGHAPERTAFRSARQTKFPHDRDRGDRRRAVDERGSRLSGRNLYIHTTSGRPSAGFCLAWPRRGSTFRLMSFRFCSERARATESDGWLVRA
jgi:hypothetical protein